MSKEGLTRFFQDIPKKYGRYLDYIDFPPKEEVKSYFRNSARTILAYFKGGNGKKRRIPIFSFWLLLILFALNVGVTVHNSFVSASPFVPRAPASSAQTTTKTQTQTTDTSTVSSHRITGKEQLDDGTTYCPKTPDASAVTMADIVEYASEVSDDPGDVQNYATSQSSSPTTLTINSNGTQIVVNNSSGTTTANDQAIQQAIEQNCEQAFNGGTTNVKDGSEVYEATWTETRDKDHTYFSLCHNQGDKLLVDLTFDQNPHHVDYCLYVKSNNNWIFPCSDIGTAPNYTAIKGDWLSGDIDAANSNSGHFEQTTVTEPVLFPAMQGIGLAILLPSIVLIGLQMAVGGSGFRMAGAMESASRVIMGAVLIFVCYGAIQILLGMSNTLAQAVVTFHGSYAYPQPTYYYALPPGQTADNNTPQIDFGYTLGTEAANDASSYRGIVMPVSRWGCTANAFMGILGSKLATDMAGYIPIIGNFIKAAGQIADAVELVKNAGEFIKTIMSVMLAVQLLIRLVLLNFYIMIAPIAFACWALPGGVGQNVVRSWFKGFLSVLAIQVVQVFVITVTPLLIPTTLPQFPTDSTNVLNAFIHELPSIAILWAVLRVPKMLGTSATSMVSSAGQITGGAIVAVGAAAYNIV